MIAGLLVVLLTGPPAAAPVCGADGREAARRELLQELNRARSDAGRPVLAPHPALCDIARWRAERVRASGDPGADVDELNEMTRRLYAGGYHPHAWIQSALVGDPLAGKFEQWRTVRPDW